MFFKSFLSSCFPTFDSKKTSFVAAGLLLTLSSPAHAVITLKVEQVGNDVHVIGSGSANLAALTPEGTVMDFQNVLTDTQIYAGASIFSGSHVDLYGNVLTGPTTISTDIDLIHEPDLLLSSGGLFGIQTNPYTLVLPAGYQTNDPLVGVSVYKNLSLSDLKLNPGLSTWTWGSMGLGTFDSINLEVVPGPLPLAGAAAAYGWSACLRRRIRAVRSISN